MKMIFKFGLGALSLICLGWAVVSKDSLSYPKSPQKPFIENFHGVEIHDPYQWLEEGENPEVIAWSEKQNSLTLSKLEFLPSYRPLITRLTELSRYDDISFVDVIDSARVFIWTHKANDERWVFSYQDDHLESPVVLLNPNEWPKEETLEFATPSRDGEYVAFGKALGGNEKPLIQILEVRTGKILTDTVVGSRQGWPEGKVSWLPDNQGFFYTATPVSKSSPDEENYWTAVYYHQLGTQANQDIKVFEDAAVKEHFHYAEVSEDGRWVIYTRSKMGNATQVYIGPADPSNLVPMKPITTSFDNAYFVIPVTDKLLIMTNRDAPLHKLYITDIVNPSEENWREFIPEAKDCLVNVSATGGKLYLQYLHQASTLIQEYNLEGKYERDIPLPTLGTASVSGFWSKPKVWVDFSSFLYPHSRFAYHSDTQQLTLFHEVQLPFNANDYLLEQSWYPSKDGTSISLFLLRRKNLDMSIPQPTLLAGYGGFNVSITPTFSESLIAFLELGGMIAIPNLRGGGEYGKVWHEAGMKGNKQNVFDDFIAAAEWLIKKKYTHPSKLAIRGGSNGGLLVGAALTQRPDLFHAVLCEVPLLDMIKYHRFGFANIWADEYGTSDSPEEFHYLLRYSPYHNIKETESYPSSLFVAAENDSRVDPLHARKMVARLQNVSRQKNPCLLLVTKNSGHAGGTTITAQIEQRALALSFLICELGLNPKLEKF